MAEVPWVLVVVLVLLLVFGVIAVALKRKTRRPTDYYAFFLIGVMWILISIPSGDYSFSLVGLIFALIGLSHRSEWKKNHVTWEMMSKEEKQGVIIAVVVAFLFAGILAFYLR